MVSEARTLSRLNRHCVETVTTAKRVRDHLRSCRNLTCVGVIEAIDDLSLIGDEFKRLADQLRAAAQDAAAEHAARLASRSEG